MFWGFRNYEPACVVFRSRAFKEDRKIMKIEKKKKYRGPRRPWEAPEGGPGETPEGAAEAGGSPAALPSDTKDVPGGAAERVGTPAASPGASRGRRPRRTAP